MFTSKFTSKNQLLNLVIITIALFSNAAKAQSQKTLTHSFYPTESVVVVNLGDNIKVKTWDKTTVQVQTYVNYINQKITDKTANGIVELGRYELKITSKYQSLQVNAPSIHHVLKRNGKLLKDKVNYTLYVPKNITVIDVSTSKEIYATN